MCLEYFGAEPRFGAGQGVPPAGQTLDGLVCGPAALGLQAALPVLLHVGFRPDGGYLQGGLVCSFPYENTAEGNCIQIAQVSHYLGHSESPGAVNVGLPPLVVAFSAPPEQKVLPSPLLDCSLDKCQNVRLVRSPGIRLCLGLLDSRGCPLAHQCSGASGNQVDTVDE